MTSQAIENFAFGDALVRVVMRDDEPWFVGIDVCRCLELKNPRSTLDLIAEEDKGVHTVDTPGGQQSVTIVSEGAMYGLVFKSRKPIAQKFQRWVTHEVLPAIRRRGFYGETPADDADPRPDPARIGAESSFSERLRCVELALRVHGRARAQALWRTLDLPAVPKAPLTRLDEAYLCLRHLLDFPVEDPVAAALDTPRDTRSSVRAQLDRALDGCEGARAALFVLGIKAHHERDGFMVANCGPALKLFEGTQWARGKHFWVLRRLHGAEAERGKFGGTRVYRSTFLPATYLDEADAPAPETAQVI